MRWKDSTSATQYRAVEGTDDEAQHAAAVSSITGIVTAPLKQRQPLTGRELPFLRSTPRADQDHAAQRDTVPRNLLQIRHHGPVYRDPYALLDAITAIMAEDIRTLAASGISYLQIDAPRYSYYLDPKWTAWMEKELRVDPEQMLTASLERRQCLLRRRAPDRRHSGDPLCRGNNRSHWYAEGGYEAIAERLFHELAVDRFLLEYDDERSGTFEPLRLVPKGKIVVLGLVSTKRADLERKEDLLRRIDEAAKVLPLEQLALSPQCGFASTMEGNLLTEADQWAKLQLVVETAREVWG